MGKTRRDIGTVLAPNGLLEDGYVYYMQKHHGKELARASRVPRGVAPDDPLAIMDVESVTANGDGDNTLPVDADMARAHENIAKRGATLTWLKSKPLVPVLVVSMCYLPFEKRLRREATMHSMSSATKMASRRVTDESSEDPIRGLLGSTVWPWMMCANGEHDRKTCRDISEMHRPSNWQGLPPSSRTVGLRARITVALSRSGCYNHEHMVVPHTLPPFDNFLLLLDEHRNDPTSAHKNKLVTRSVCLQDAYTSDFFNHYRKDECQNGDIDCFLALLELTLLIMFRRRATTAVENYNAILRRILSQCYAARRMRYMAMPEKFCLARWRVRELNMKALPAIGRLGAKRSVHAAILVVRLTGEFEESESTSRKMEAVGRGGSIAASRKQKSPRRFRLDIGTCRPRNVLL